MSNADQPGRALVQPGQFCRMIHALTTPPIGSSDDDAQDQRRHDDRQHIAIEPLPVERRGPSR